MLVDKLIAAAVALGIVLTAFFGYGQWRAHNAQQAERQRWELAVGRLNAEAVVKLGKETTKVLAMERALGLMTSQLETLHEQRRNESSAAGVRLADAMRAGRLRDPNAQCGGGGDRPPDSATARAGGDRVDTSAAGGLLSANLTGLLQRLTREADAINDAYAICRADAMNLRIQINERTEGKEAVVSPM